MAGPGSAGPSKALQGSRSLHGIDFGVEFQKDATRLYVEYQRGEILFGASLGPVLEFKESQTNFGIQGSAWGDMYGGMDLRLRYLTSGGFAFAPGVFVKVPGKLNDGDFGIHGN